LRRKSCRRWIAASKKDREEEAGALWPSSDEAMGSSYASLWTEAEVKEKEAKGVERSEEDTGE